MILTSCLKLDEPARYSQKSTAKKKRGDDRHERDFLGKRNGVNQVEMRMDIYTHIHIHKHHQNVK